MQQRHHEAPSGTAGRPQFHPSGRPQPYPSQYRTDCERGYYREAPTYFIPPYAMPNHPTYLPPAGRGAGGPGSRRVGGFNVTQPLDPTWEPQAGSSQFQQEAAANEWSSQAWKSDQGLYPSSAAHGEEDNRRRTQSTSSTSGSAHDGIQGKEMKPMSSTETSDSDSDSDSDISESESATRLHKTPMYMFLKKQLVGINRALKARPSGATQEAAGESKAPKTKEGSVSASAAMKGKDTYACAMTSLSSRVTPRVRKAIIKGKFTDVYDLSTEGLQAKKKAKAAGDEGGNKHKTMGNWLRGYLVLASCLLEKHPEEGLNVLKYIELIHDTHKTYGGAAWHEYDEEFRHKMHGNPVLNFGTKDLDLWIRRVTPEKLAPFARGPGGRPANQPPGKPKRSECWAFNKNSCSKGGECRFLHVCSICSGGHPAHKCFRNAKTTGKQADSGPGKGGNAN
ncbi:hypothetical protein FKM82_000111 [Ascaphus truei]